MISRHWIGIVKREKLNEYLAHLENTVMPRLSRVKGMSNAYYLKREVTVGVEFLVVTEWDNLDAIIGFAGEDYDQAVIDDYAKSLMVSYDQIVKHYVI